MTEAAAVRYDLVIIGSGPAAIAALDGLSGPLRLAIVTGESSQPGSGAWLHPKIRAVAAERDEPAGVADPLGRAGKRRTRPLWATAAIGGLANYWGQQFVPVSSGDAWPADAFRTHADYLAEVGAIENLFRLEGGEALEGILPRPGYHMALPRLLTGSTNMPATGLSAMREAFAMATVRFHGDIIAARAHSIAPDGEGWTVKLFGGGAIAAKRVLLAAGVIGDAQLLLRSFTDLEAASFADHMPWMLYASGLRQLLCARPDFAPNHFNALTIEQHDGATCTSFASLYDMSLADLNLLSAAIVGRCFSVLRGRVAPRAASLVTPIQLWTERSVGRMEIISTGEGIAAQSRTVVRSDKDPALADVAALLRAAGGQVLRTSRTAPGLGFHYHDLRVRPRGGPWRGIADLLEERTGEGVICVDSAVLEKIGCRPPTLTAMAKARRLAARLCGGGADILRSEPEQTKRPPPDRTAGRTG